MDKTKAKIQEKRKSYEKAYKLNNKDKISLQGKRYYQKNKESINKKQLAYTRNGGNLKRYNMTLELYEILLKEQKGVCAICKDYETSTLRGVVKKLSVDHCHKTGKIRGLLCNSCNRGIGYLRDSSLLAKQASAYLKKYGR